MIKSVGSKTSLDPINDLHKKAKSIEDWNDMKVSKGWQYFLFLEKLSFSLWLKNRLISSLTNEKMYLKDSDDIKKAQHQGSTAT